MLLQLGHSHYILRMTDPDRVIYSMSEEIKIKFLNQLMLEEKK